MTSLLFGILCLRIGNMVPVTWIILFAGRFLPILLGRRRTNPFVFPRSQRLVPGPCSNFMRDSCFMDSGVVDRAAMWWVYFCCKTACDRYCEAMLK